MLLNNHENDFEILLKNDNDVCNHHRNNSDTLDRNLQN